MSKVQAILDLLGRGVADHHVADRTGVTESYVRAVRSRYTAPDAQTFWLRRKCSRVKTRRIDTAPCLQLPASPKQPRKPQQRLGYRRRPTGQPREELRALAETLYRWRTEGRGAL